MMCSLAFTQEVFHETWNSSKDIPASHPAQACEKNTDTEQKKKIIKGFPKQKEERMVNFFLHE